MIAIDRAGTAADAAARRVRSRDRDAIVSVGSDRTGGARRQRSAAAIGEILQVPAGRFGVQRGIAGAVRDFGQTGGTVLSQCAFVGNARKDGRD